MRRADLSTVSACLGVLVLLLGAAAQEARAAPCAVPSGSYPTIQSAVDDASCDPVQLGSQSYVESVTVARSVTVQGVSSTATAIEGQVTVLGGTVALNQLKVDTTGILIRGRFHQALLAQGSARVSGTDLVVLHRALLFGDGFETGDTSAWAATVP